MDPDVPAPGGVKLDEERRLNEILDVILAVAANDFGRRATVGTGDHILDGIAAGLNMLIEEVSIRKRSEEEARSRLLQAERLAAIGTLAAGVAHEVNNPAAFLLGNFVALNDHVASLRGRIRPENQGTLDEIAEIARVGKDGVERIAKIVRGLRNFARIEDHAVSEVRLDEIAEQACVLASHEIAQRARFVKKLSPVTPIVGERTKLTQLVTNLLLNASQAIEGPASENEIELTITERDQRLHLRVRDTGSGIPLEVQPRIFQPFFTTKSYGKGTGLGLSVSADIARQHGGVLRFESTPGEGTIFELDLPLLNGLVALPPASRSPVSKARATAAPAKPRVLFIDDEEQLLRSYKRMLRDCDVTLAAGGRAAIELLERGQSYDVIFCDISMPDIDGTEVWAWLEANAPELANRVLFCTGGAFTERGGEFVAQHPERILEKPIGRAELEAAVARMCEVARVTVRPCERSES